MFLHLLRLLCWSNWICFQSRRETVIKNSMRNWTIGNLLVSFNPLHYFLSKFIKVKFCKRNVNDWTNNWTKERTSERTNEWMDAECIFKAAGYRMTVVKSNLIWPITTNVNNTLNQSKREAELATDTKRGKKLAGQVTSGFGFVLDWLRKQ